MAESGVSGRFFKDILNEMHALGLPRRGSKALDADFLLWAPKAPGLFFQHATSVTCGDETISTHVRLYVHTATCPHVHMGACARVRMSTSTSVQRCTCTHVHTYTCTHVGKFTCANVHMYTGTQVHIHTWTHIHIYTSRHLPLYTVHMCTCTHLHMYTCAHVHMCTRAHGFNMNNRSSPLGRNSIYQRHLGQNRNTCLECCQGTLCSTTHKSAAWT